MPIPSNVKHYRLVQWALSKPVSNEMLDEDADYTIQGIDEREYRYECSVLRCRSLWDLRMTPSGIFCAAHYLPWLHKDSNRNTIPLNVCERKGCCEPQVSARIDETTDEKLRFCRTHILGDITDQDLREMAEMLVSLNRDNPHILGHRVAPYSRSINIRQTV